MVAVDVVVIVVVIVVVVFVVVVIISELVCHLTGTGFPKKTA